VNPGGWLAGAFPVAQDIGVACLNDWLPLHEEVAGWSEVRDDKETQKTVSAFLMPSVAKQRGLFAGPETEFLRIAPADSTLTRFFHVWQRSRIPQRRQQG
jgi:hypothetical protein